jgi:hypothetical protein
MSSVGPETVVASSDSETGDEVVIGDGEDENNEV